MQDQNLLLVIRAKLADGVLPAERRRSGWGRPGTGETCVACDGTISESQLVMEGVGEGPRALRFHVQCFHIWDTELLERAAPCK